MTIAVKRTVSAPRCGRLGRHISQFMGKIRFLWRKFFDIREGEHLRTLLMSLYLLTVLFAYYILKPVSRAMFLNEFRIDRLPYLYILIAIAGGLLAASYTRVAVQSSLKAAVGWATMVAVSSLIAFWWLVQMQLPWMLYVFNIWVSLFGIVLVSQGWLVAANVFTTREAKRVYGLVGLGAVVGAWVGSAFTALTVKLAGVENLLLVSAGLVLVAFAIFRILAALKDVSLEKAKAAEARREEFSVRDVMAAIGRHRHLQVFTAIMLLMFVVDVLVDYQWQAAAKRTYEGAEALADFMGTFYLYLNIATFFLQFVLTGVIVRTLGVGGTLKTMPVSVAAASLGSLLSPGVITASIARLVEGASRYTFNRTGMELLYLPLPTELRNRTKAFVDIFMDRAGRGIGGMLLVALTWAGLTDPRQLPLLVIAFTALWLLLTTKAQKEYVLTVRKRLESRRLDLEDARVTVGDPHTLALLEQAAHSVSPRQARYALSMLAEAPGYTLDPLLTELAGSPLEEVRGEVYDLARRLQFPALMDRAPAEVASSLPGENASAVRQAVRYVLSISSDPARIRQYLEHGNPLVTEATLEAIAELPEEARDSVTGEWLTAMAAEPDPERRRLAAVAIGSCGDEGTEVLHRLLEDPDPKVVTAACNAAGRLRNRAYVHRLLPRLASPKLRGTVIDALAAYGTRIVGTLTDVLEDDRLPVAVRRHVPRVLKQIQDQRSVDALLRSIDQPNLALRAAVLKALNSLRENAPGLNYGEAFVTRQILNEARRYFELHAALAPFAGQKGSRTAAGLLAQSIEERLKQTLERLFRLLGLRYPPKEIYSAYLALQTRRREQFATAVEFLDNVLDRELKRILLPLLDDSGQPMERGRALFGLEVKSTEEAIRDLIRSGDSWLVTCAMAAAAELKLRSLAPEIAEAARGAGVEVCEVARSAEAALA